MVHRMPSQEARKEIQTEVQPQHTELLASNFPVTSSDTRRASERAREREGGACWFKSVLFGDHDDQCMLAKRSILGTFLAPLRRWSGSSNSHVPHVGLHLFGLSVGGEDRKRGFCCKVPTCWRCVCMSFAFEL